MMSSIGENVVGGLLASQVQGMIEMLISRITEDIKKAWGLKKEYEDLKEECNILRGILEGASGQPIPISLMAEWLKKIKEAVEDADILLDECSYEALKDGIQTGMLGETKNKVKIEGKVGNVMNLIKSIYHDAEERGIKPIEVAAGEVYSGKHSLEIEKQYRELHDKRQSVDAKNLLGREQDITNLVNLLCDPDNSKSDLTVIGIVGLAGLGKTTLCKRISTVPQVIEFFDLVVLLVVSHGYDLMDLLKRIGEILFKEALNMNDRQALILKLQEKLKEKRYLLILDDVWDTISWESLKITLEDIGGRQGTTILVTSRQAQVVESMLTYCRDSDGQQTLKKPKIYQLKGLSESDSWSLFNSRVSDGSPLQSEKESIARMMLNKCEGVPLAIRALGDLLRDKTLDEWEEIKGKPLWVEVDDKGILPILRLSYDYLPTIGLKKCFAYCAVFGEDEVIEKDDLIYMWMAQGFLQPFDEMELTGEKYIKHLLNSSLFQEPEMGKRGNIKTFKMHDLVWTLARDVSMGECLCFEKYVETRELRHVSILSNFDSSESFPKLRTCVVRKKLEISSLQSLLECKWLKVLDLGRINWDEEIDWGPLGSLKHLRYFRILVEDEEGFCQSNFGDQITKLHHLQTLCIEADMVGNRYEAHFLEHMRNLVNLRHILTDFVIGIPVGLGYLTALRTLPAINLSMNWGGRPSDIKLLTNLRGKLELHDLIRLTVEEAGNLYLHNMSNLESLILEWYDIRSHLDLENQHANEILEALKPNKNLRKLTVANYDGTAFPRWLSGGGSPLSNLVSLVIDFCLKADGNLKVENFICLRTLIVQSCKKLTITLPNNGSQCCISLKVLHVCECYRIEELEHLSLQRQLEDIHISCNESSSKDVLVGLGGLRNLRKLETDLQVPADLGEESPVCKSLEELSLNGSNYCGDTTDLPDQLQHLVALQDLTIWGFRSVEAIPNWLGNLTSLTKLTLFKMPKLKHLPPQEIMLGLPNLRTFSCNISECPLLKEDLKNETGEWFKIAHIPLKTIY